LLPKSFKLLLATGFLSKISFLIVPLAWDTYLIDNISAGVLTWRVTYLLITFSGSFRRVHL
jgi:hypothetical protein